MRRNGEVGEEERGRQSSETETIPVKSYERRRARCGSDRQCHAKSRLHAAHDRYGGSLVQKVPIAKCLRKCALRVHILMRFGRMDSRMPRKLWSQLQQDLTYSWHPLPFGCITRICGGLSPPQESMKDMPQSLPHQAERH